MQTHGHGGRELGLAAFGLGLLTDLTPPGCWQPSTLSEPILRMRQMQSQEIAAIWSGCAALGWQGTVDGASFTARHGKGGDLLFVHGDDPDQSGRPAPGTRAIHHLSTDRKVLNCAPSDPLNTCWWRVALDSVLFTVALAHGYEALHAAAVVAPERDCAIAITASSGGGKSTLLSELLRRGLPMMADDVLVLCDSDADAAPLAHPAPPLMTVPTARLNALAQHCDAVPSIGDAGSMQPICRLDEECWIAVPAHPDPLPLRCLVVLDRRPRAQPAMTRIEDSLAPLMRALMNFPRTRKRERARFELASKLAATTSLWRLSADLDTPPDVLADTLLDSVLRAPRPARTYAPPQAVVGLNPVDRSMHIAVE